MPSDTEINSNSKTILFMVALSFVCALILSSLASALEKPQELARELDRSEQMLIAARIVNPAGYFQVKNEEGEFIPAKYAEEGILVPADEKIPYTSEQLLEVYRKRIEPFLLNQDNELVSFDQAGVNMEDYLKDYKKMGYYTAPLKLIYKILPNDPAQDDQKADGYVIPVNGYGLWDVIHGYLAIEPDGNTVIGISWYDQKETPGLGAVISETDWQNQFHGKKIFRQGPGGETDFEGTQLGIAVVKGKVSETLGETPRAKSAVDGISGATITGNGVADAYRKVLNAYRPFLVKLASGTQQDQSSEQNKESS